MLYFISKLWIYRQEVKLLTQFINNKTLKLLFIPLLVAVISLSLAMVYRIQLETTLPSEGWSREIPFPIYSANAKPFVVKESDGFHVYAPDEKGISHLITDQQLRQKHLSHLDVDLLSLKPFWAGGEQLVFIRDQQLILFKDHKEEVIFKEADGMIANESTVLFWQGKDLFSLNLNGFRYDLIQKMKDPIEKVIINQENSTSFLVVSTPDPTHYQLTFFQIDQNHQILSFPLFMLTEYLGETISDFHFALDGNHLSIIYTTSSTKQGTITKRAYYTDIHLNQLENEPKFKQISIYEKGESLPLENPQHIQLEIRDHQPVILLFAEGSINSKETGFNIYEAAYENGKWTAEKRSKTPRLSVHPTWLDDQTMIWLDFFANGVYHLLGTTTDPTIVKESQSVRSNDVMSALSDTLVSLSASLLIILTAFVWVLPPAVFIVVLLMVNIRLIEKNTPWVKYTAISLYLITQLLTIKQIFNPYFYLAAPAYLTFKSSYITIPVLIAILSFLIYNFGKIKDWDGIKELLYYVFVNIWMVIFILGPYFI